MFLKRNKTINKILKTLAMFYEETLLKATSKKHTVESIINVHDNNLKIRRLNIKSINHMFMLTIKVAHGAINCPYGS